MAKILIIDDDPVYLEVALGVLEAAGYDVATESKPLTAVREIGRLRPDIVLLDLELPGLRGDQFIDLLVRDFAADQAPLVFLHSGHEAEELRQVAVSSGADGALCKTNDPTEFLARFEALVRQRPPSQR